MAKQNQTNTTHSQEPKILERTLKCCVLNGCFFWFSIIVFENILMPFLQGLVLVFLGQNAGAALWSNVRIILREIESSFSNLTQFFRLYLCLV